MEVKTLISTIYETHKTSQPVNNLGWWFLILKNLEENMESEEIDNSAWPDLLKNLQKILNFWLKKSTKWEISSLTMLMEKISKLPGGILAMSFNLTLCNNVLKLWSDYVNMEELDEAECSDFLSNMITSMSSTTALSAAATAGTSGVSKSNLLDQLGQLVQKTNQFGNSKNPTGTMSSSISFLENGELVKYGLEEKVGKNRLTVSLLSNIHYNIYLYYFFHLLDKLVRWQEIFDSANRSLVGLEDSFSDGQCSGQSYKRDGRAIDSTYNNEFHGKRAKTGGLYSYIKLQTKALLLKYYVSPISAIRDIDEFRNDDLLSNPNNIKYIQAALDDFGKDLNMLTLKEIYNILSNENIKPIFIRSMEYGNMEESLEWIDELLNYQYKEDVEEIQKFLIGLVDVLDRRIPKCNGFSVIAPPSSGKNFFFDMIFALCLNYGQLGQANKHNVFAFQEAPNKRVLVWNEPNYEWCLTDTIKMMMGGDPYNVRVKHSMDTHVARTPVIILSNKPVGFHIESAFEDRIIKHTWEAAQFLKKIELKPYPMSFFSLLNKYNITF
nr:MAG: non-structural protein 1 [Canine parvovirus]